MEEILKDYQGSDGYVVRIVKDKHGTYLNIAYFECNHFCDEVSMSIEFLERILAKMKEIAG